MITRGASPPDIVPFCRICGICVESFTLINPDNDFYAVTVEAQCCGRTQGMRVTFEQLMRVRTTGEKLYCVAKKGDPQYVGVDRMWTARRAV